MPATGPTLITTATVPQPVKPAVPPVIPADGSNQVTEVQTPPQTQSPNNTLSNLPTTLTNNKEKTPMCLINELARYNKIQHQYRLTSEQGPAHKKRFTVTLKLGWFS